MAYLDKIQIKGTTYDIQDSNLKSALTYNVVGFDIYKLREDKSTAGIEWSWDAVTGMYHAQGTASGLSVHNVFYEKTIFPDGMAPGKKYRLTLKQVGVGYKGGFDIYTFKNNDYTKYQSFVYSDDVLRETYQIELPSDAEGLWLRFNVRSGETVDHYFGAEITGEDEYTAYQIAKLMKEEKFSLFGVLRDVAQANLSPIATDSEHWASCDDIDRPCMGYITNSNGTKSISDYPLDNGWLISLANGYVDTYGIQMAISTKDESKHLVRYKHNGTWGNWIDETFKNCLILPNNTNVNTVVDSGSYLLLSSRSYTGLPFANNNGSWLLVFRANTWSIQIAGEMRGNTVYVQTLNHAGTVYSAWKPICNGDHGWLLPVDTESADEIGKTDMTSAIMTQLTATGYCHLAPGIYYVGGNLDMPVGSMLEGCGRDTVIRLLSSVESGYCVKATRYTTIKNIRFSGAYSDIDTSTSTVGSRNGISIPDSVSYQNKIVECYFDNFSGAAIYQNNNGGSTIGYANVTNCYINNCEIGININYKSEYCKYTDVVTKSCYYACINNGGNNVFMNCTFHGVIGFTIDNSNNDKPNNAHGSAVGCVFNHIDNQANPSELGMGDAVVIKNVENGFVFTGCQFWYGEIRVYNGRGISFSNCLIGGNTPVIEVTGDYPVFFDGCIFQAEPTINVTAGSKFDNCYLSATGAAIRDSDVVKIANAMAEYNNTGMISATDNPIHMTNTAKSPFNQFNVSEVSSGEKLTVCGKNLFVMRHPQNVVSHDNTRYEFDKANGVIRVVATTGATADNMSASDLFPAEYQTLNGLSRLHNFNFKFKEDTVIALSGNCSVYQSHTYGCKFQVTDGTRVWNVSNAGTTMIAKAGVQYGARIMVKSGWTGDITFKPQIEISESPTIFEPYTGYIAPLTNANGNINLFDLTNYNRSAASFNDGKIIAYFNRSNNEIKIVATSPTVDTRVYNSYFIDGVNTATSYQYIWKAVTGAGPVFFSCIPKELAGLVNATISDGISNTYFDEGDGVMFAAEADMEYAVRFNVMAGAEFDYTFKPVVATGIEAYKLAGSREGTTNIFTDSGATITVTAEQMTVKESAQNAESLVSEFAKATGGRFAGTYKRPMPRRPMVVFIDDDTTSIYYVQRYHDIFAAKGVVGNYAVMTKHLDDNAGLPELLLDYEVEGFGCLYHCYYQSGDATGYWRPETRDMELVRENFVRGLRSFREYGFLTDKHWVTPYGVNDADIRNMAKSHGMESLIKMSSGLPSGEMLTPYGVLDRWDIPRYTISAASSEQGYQEQINACAATNGLLLCVTHVNTWDSTDTMDTKLANAIQYAIDHGVAVVSYPEAYEDFKACFYLNELY